MYTYILFSSFAQSLLKYRVHNGNTHYAVTFFMLPKNIQDDKVEDFFYLAKFKSLVVFGGIFYGNCCGTKCGYYDRIISKKKNRKIYLLVLFYFL
jgi:hypothetical protein